MLLDHNNNNPPPYNANYICNAAVAKTKQNKTAKDKKQSNNDEKKYIGKIHLWKKHMISVVTKTNYC